MNHNTSQPHRVREFARLAGVTVRALHHYDRLGLLRPHRNKSGYRLYTDDDLMTLEQVVALRFIGLPRKSIKGLLRKPGPELAKALQTQRAVLEQKRQLLDRTITAVTKAETALRTDARPDHALFTQIIEVIEMQTQRTGSSNMTSWCRQR